MATAFEGVVRRQIAAARGGNLSDRELLRRFVEQKDEAAFALLVRRHTGMVLGVCRSVLAREAEDACQATFLLLARKAAEIRNPDALAGWLHAVAYRTAGKARKEAIRRHACERRAAEPEAQSSADDLSWREVAGVLHEELRRLPEKYRPPLILCCLEGHTRDEAARQLGWSTGKLKGMLDRGRSLLRRRLERRGLALSAALLTVTLARSTVSAAAGEAVARAARAFANGELNTPAATLADALLRSVSTLRASLRALLLAFAVVAVGTGVCLGHRPARDEDPPPPVTGRSVPAPRLDGQGDPLPPGAVARLGTGRFVSYGSMQITFSPDGRRVFTQCGSVTVLDPKTGKELRRINADRRTVNSMSLSPDGKLLAIGTDSNDKSVPSCVQILDAETGRLLVQCLDPVDQHQYLEVRFSPDGKAVASYFARTVQLWDATTGKEIRHWRLAAEDGGCPTFSRDGRTLFAADGRTVLFWDIATGREVHRIADHPGFVVYQLALSPDGKVLASQALSEESKGDEGNRQDNKLYLWDVATGKQIGRIEVVADAAKVEPIRDGRRVEDVALSHFHFSPDGKSLVTSGGDGVLRVWDVVTQRLVRQWDAADWGCDFAFSPDGKVLASLGSGWTVRLWDPATGKELSERPGLRTDVRHLALSPDGRTLATAGLGREIRLWDTATGRELRRIATPDWVIQSLYFSSDGRTLFTTGDRTTVRIRDARTGRELRQFQVPMGRREGREVSRALSPDGKVCASVIETWKEEPKSESGIVLWDAVTGSRLVSVPDAGFPSEVAFSAGGGTVRAWIAESQIREWDAATGAVLRETHAGDGPYDGTEHYTGSFSPDGDWFVSTGRGETLLFYHLPTANGHRRVEAPGTGESWPHLAFSPDSRTLALGNRDGVRLYEMASGKLRRSLAGGDVTALAFSPNSRQLFSGSSDTTTLIWGLPGRDGSSARPAELSPAEADARWAELASADAATAYRAVWMLSLSPEQTVALLKDRLRPTSPADAGQLARLIARLDAAEFADRDAASKELEGLGERAEAALRRTLAGQLSAEQRKRAEALVSRVEGERLTPGPAILRGVRAVEVLEHIGSPEAVRLLRELATGLPEARLTREAAASLRRLTARSKAVP